MAICSRSQGELLHQADKAFVLQSRAAQQVVGGHTHLVKEQLGSVLRFEPQFLQPFAHRKAGHAALDQQQTGAFAARSRVGFGHDDDQIGVPAVGDEGLAAVQEIAAIGLLQRSGFDALQV